MPRLQTFLVIDLVDSTEVLSNLGEPRQVWRQHAYLDLLRCAIATAGGCEAESSGDCMLATFEAASEAVACAVAMQHAFARQNASGEERLDIRIGIAIGEVDDGREPNATERSGGPAARARRLCEAALGGQILVSNMVAV